AVKLVIDSVKAAASAAFVAKYSNSPAPSAGNAWLFPVLTASAKRPQGSQCPGKGHDTAIARRFCGLSLRRVSSREVLENRELPSYLTIPSNARVLSRRKVADGSVPSASAMSSAVAGASQGDPLWKTSRRHGPPGSPNSR